MFTIALVEISIDCEASPPCPYSIAGSPSGNLATPRSRLHGRPDQAVAGDSAYGGRNLTGLGGSVGELSSGED